jgi:hypothetical protein
MADSTIRKGSGEAALERRRARNRAYAARIRAERPEHLRNIRAKHADTAKAYMENYVRTHADTYKAAQDTYRRSDKGRATYKAWSQRFYSQPANRIRRLVKAAKGRALRAGRDFDPTLADVLANTPATHCACCRCELDYSVGRGAERWTSPSLDRIDPAGGYTVANVAVICMRCNTRKTDFTVEQLQDLLSYMQRVSLHS